MGRKIPAKKHRGVKDPLKQQAERLLKLKFKINAPPKDPDEQPIPRSLTDLFAFQNKVEQQKKQENKRNRNVKQSTERKGDNPVSKLRKVSGESSREFSLRINSAIKALNNEQHEHEYPEDIEEVDRKGERIAFQRERREKKKMRLAKQNQNQKEDVTEAPKLTRLQKFALKKKEKRLKAVEKTNSAEVKYERVLFGDIAHAPPTLTKPRRAQAADGAPRPGRRDLLLSKLLNNTSTNSSNKVKQKDLPPGDRLWREKARLDAVAAYRAIKKNKLNKI